MADVVSLATVAVLGITVGVFSVLGFVFARIAYRERSTELGRLSLVWLCVAVIAAAALGLEMQHG